jgi:hypothetical protein
MKGKGGRRGNGWQRTRSSQDVAHISLGREGTNLVTAWKILLGFAGATGQQPRGVVAIVLVALMLSSVISCRPP